MTSGRFLFPRNPLLPLISWRQEFPEGLLPLWTEKAAKEKYPFLNVRHVYVRSARQTTRVMQKCRAGRVQAEVLGNRPETLVYLKQQRGFSDGNRCEGAQADQP